MRGYSGQLGAVSSSWGQQGDSAPAGEGAGEGDSWGQQGDPAPAGEGDSFSSWLMLARLLSKLYLDASSTLKMKTEIHLVKICNNLKLTREKYLRYIHQQALKN